MDIILYYFSKRSNSTKEPSYSDPTRKNVSNVQLKEETSFISPTLKLSADALGSGFSPVKYNYVSIPYWQRHYFVKDWRWNPPYWECDLSVDVLASFKYVIGDTSAYILRSSHSFNGNITDNYYPALSNPVVTKVPVSSSWYAVSPTGGTYVLGCINYQTSNRVGAVSYYALTIAQFGQVLNFMFSDGIYNSMAVDEISDGLFKAMFNPMQYITSCVWFPFDITAFGSSTTNVKVGYWSTGVQGIMVSALAERTFVTAQIPHHPQIARGSFLDRNPYTKLTLYIPPFGSIPIDSIAFSTGDYLYSAVLIDHITGQATIRISTCKQSSLDHTNIITERSGEIGVPIQLAQVLTDDFHSLTAIGGAVGSLVTGNIGGAISGISSAIENQMPKVATSGANGSFCAFIQEPVLMVEHYKITEENLEENGRPLCETKIISTIPGYIQCADADHNFAATETERQMINDYMKSGFYYE